MLTFQAPASATLTFTRISTPSARTTLLAEGGSATFTISGTASSDVSQVDVYCIRGQGAGPDATLVEAGVAVAAGSFTTSAPIPNVDGASPVCRLRALPSGVLPSDSVTPFSGPVLNIDTLRRTTDGTNTLDFRLAAGSQDGEVQVGSAGKCGDAAMGTLSALMTPDGDADGCVADLGGTVGSVRVGSHPALLPPEVLAFTSGTSPLRLRVHTLPSGQVTWTESARLVRCSGTDAYPPASAGACGTLLQTGVSFQRSGTFDQGGHQIRLRDSFTSNDGHAHALHLVYGAESTPPPTGGLGFSFPWRSGGFRASTAGQVVTGLPHHAATFLVRTDRLAAPGDPQASTRAVTWSRAPSRLAFASSDASVLAMTYALSVPASGSVRLGFTDSQAVQTSVASGLAGHAEAGMMPVPRITSPTTGAVISGTKTVVTGALIAGANGLPISVSVNGHPASLKPAGSSRATFRCIFTEKLGKHTITVVAHDAGGNQRAASIQVRNK